jgi:WD40 repeat protein
LSAVDRIALRATALRYTALLALSLLTALTLGSSPNLAQSPPQQVYVVRTPGDTLNLRTRPQATDDHDITASVPDGTRLVGTGRLIRAGGQDWAEITYNGTSVWAARRYLAPVPAAAPESTGPAPRPSREDEVEVVPSVGHAQGARVIVAPNGRLLLSIGQEQDIKLWDMESGHLLREFTGRQAAFSPDAGVLAIARGATIELYDPASKLPLQAFVVPADHIKKLAFSPDGRILALTHESTIRLLNLRGGKLHPFRVDHPGVYPKGTDWIVSMAFTNAGRSIMSLSADGALKIWDPATGLIHRSLSCRGSTISPNGKLIATARQATNPPWTRTIELLDTSSCKLLAELSTPGTWNTHPKLVFSADGTRLAAADFSDLDVWDVANSKKRHSINPGSLHSIALSPDGNTIAYSDGNGGIGLHGIGTTYFRRFNPGAQHLSFFAASPDGSFFATRDTFSATHFWSGTAGSPVQTLYGAANDPKLTRPDRWFSGVEAFSADGRLAVDFLGSLLDVRTGERVAVLPFSRERIHRAVFSQDSSQLAISTSDTSPRSVYVYRGILQLGGVHQLALKAKEGAEIAALQFTPDGQLLLLADERGRLWSWNTITAEHREIRALPKATKPSNRDPWRVPRELAALAPDASIAVISSEDMRRVAVYDTKTGQEMSRLQGTLYDPDKDWEPNSIKKRDYDLGKW